MRDALLPQQLLGHFFLSISTGFLALPPGMKEPQFKRFMAVPSSGP
jgi:hypothetical protein